VTISRHLNGDLDVRDLAPHMRFVVELRHNETPAEQRYCDSSAGDVASFDKSILA
jgi:hypothetical protein